MEIQMNETVTHFGLKPEAVSALQAVFSNYPAVEKVILYGSRAKGNYRRGSDIDLTMVGHTLTLSLQFKIETELDDLLLPQKIDLSILHTISNPDLVAHIERVGQVVYEKAG